MDCPLCGTKMNISWRASFEEAIFYAKDETYEMKRQPATFIVSCRDCRWQELYDRLPGTKMHAAQFGELVEFPWNKK